MEAGRMSKRRWGVTALVLAVLFVLACVFAVAIGSTSVPLSHVVSYMLYHLPFGELWVTPNWTETEAVILTQIRIPRMVVGFIVGGALSVAGVAYQGVLRNPLADPYTLGVSSGASVGAAGTILIGGIGSGTWAAVLFLPLAAFAGACLALFAVLALGRVGRTIRVETLILAGVVVNALFGALLSLILWLSPGNTATQIIWWMIGSLTMRDWSHALTALPFFLLAWAVVLVHARDLNAMAMGDEQAQTLGVKVERTKWVLLIVASLAAAAGVAVTGVIGFVGLVVPHIVRLLLGPDHRMLIVVSGVAGGIFLVTCDILARWVLAPIELSIGVVTALVGAPFFAWLLRRKKQGGAL